MREDKPWPCARFIDASSEGCMLVQIPQTFVESVDLIPLPPLPQVLVRFLKRVEEDRPPMAELATLVLSDPALTAQFLTVANAPPFNKRQAASNLEEALVSIGLPLLRVLATCMAVRNSQSRTIFAQNFKYHEFWEHSLLVAELASSLARLVDYPDSNEAYLAGLLHDIGQVLLVGEVCDMLPGTGSHEAAQHDLENIVGNTDAAAAGACLVDHWNLSSFMADAVLFHQSSAEEIRSADLLSRVVWSAHILMTYDEKTDSSKRNNRGYSAIPAILGLDAAAIAEACWHSRAQVSEAAALLGVTIQRDNGFVPGEAFFAKQLSLPKRDDMGNAQDQLEGLIDNMAIFQPVQQSLISLTSEAELFLALRETARVVFGLRRPVFLLPEPARPVLSGATFEGQSPLLARLEIDLESCQSLAALALKEKKPRSTFVDEHQPAASLVDIQLCRALRCEGLLCLPMDAGERQLGVMVFGLSRDQFARKNGYLERMTSFAHMAAQSLATFRSLRDREQAIESDLAHKFEQNARKVIHETANPLSIINNYLKIVSQKMSTNPEVQQELSILNDEIARVERIVRRLSDLKENAPPVETINVNTVIAGMLALYGESLFESRAIAIEKHLPPELTLARADRDSLKQILFNLWKNSAEAMPEGGTFRIATRAIAGANGSSSVEIRLSDTGPGIPTDVMERLFQPLDSERRPANFGVGLSIVASLVGKLGGEIKCESTPGNGTHFTIRLPQA